MKFTQEKFNSFVEAMKTQFDTNYWALDCDINEFETQIRLTRKGRIYHFEFERQKETIKEINAAIQHISNIYELEIKIEAEQVEMFNPDLLVFTAKLTIVKPLDIVKIRPGQLFVVDGRLYMISNARNAADESNLENGQNIYQFSLLKDEV